MNRLNHHFGAIASALLLGTTGCAELGAYEAELLVPDDLALHWDQSFNRTGDDLVALVPVDLMVYGALSGEPVAGMQLKVQPDPGSVEGEGVEVLPFGDVLPMGADADACEFTVCVWDAWRDRYVEVLEGSEPLEDALRTDADGLVRAYLLVDAFPELDGPDDFGSIAVVVSMGMTDASFQLVPQ